MILAILLSYCCLGAVAGLVAGLFGVGGGLIIVPALIYAFSWQGISPVVGVHLAVGTSMATIIVTSLSSAWAHHLRGAVDWGVVGSLAPGIVLGSALGAAAATRLSGSQLQLALALFILTVALQMATGRRPAPARQLPHAAGRSGVGLAIGGLSSLLGIGGGSLTVPFLNWCNVAMQRAVAISAACGFPLAVAGAFSYMVQGYGHPELPSWSTGYVYWPAFTGIVLVSVFFARLGANLAHRLPARRLKQTFSLFLLLVGARLLYRSLA